MDASGSGKLEIYMDEIDIGSLKFADGQMLEQNFVVPVPGIYELKLRVMEAKDLELKRIVLE